MSRHSKSISTGPSLGLFAGSQRASTASANGNRRQSGGTRKKRKKKSSAQRPTTAAAATATSTSTRREQKTATLKAPDFRPLSDRMPRKSRAAAATPTPPPPPPPLAQASSYQEETKKPKSYVGRQRTRGLAMVISAHRGYDKSHHVAITADAALGISMQEAARRSANEALQRGMLVGRQPQRPKVTAADSGGVRHRNFLQQSNAAFAGQSDAQVIGRQNSTEPHARDGGDKVLRARARSIRVETPETNDTNQTDETTRANAEEEQRLLELEKLKFEEDRKRQAEQEALQFLAAVAAEEEERRQLEIAEAAAKLAEEEERRLEILAEKEAASNYAAAVAAALAKQTAAEALLQEKHRAIQAKYKLMSSPERPKTSPGKTNGKGLERIKFPLRARSRAESDYVMPEILDTTPIVLPFHLDSVAKAVAAEMQAREEYELKMKEDAKREAALRAADMKRKRSAGKVNQEESGESVSSVAGAVSLSSLSSVAASVTSMEAGDISGAIPADIEKEETGDVPRLRVYRRSRPDLPGIRPMMSPHDAAGALSFSVAMFHRDPKIRRSRWDGSLPLPPDSETCCRRGFSLLGENNVQDAILWFSVGYGQEADTYADGTQQRSNTDAHLDSYFAEQDLPDTMSVCLPRTGFDHGIVSIIARGIAYSMLGAWSQALWDFKEAELMTRGKCKDALYFCAQAHEARHETKAALVLVGSILEQEPRGQTIMIHLDDGEFDSIGGGSGDDHGGAAGHSRSASRVNQSVTSYDDVFYSHVLTLKAGCLAEQGKYEEALSAYDMAIEKDFANTSALWSRTRLFLDPVVSWTENTQEDDELARKRAALKDLTKLVSLDPGKVDYLEDAMDMFVDLAEYEEGKSVVQVLIEVWTAGGVSKTSGSIKVKDDAFSSSDLPSDGFEREIFLTYFPDRQSHPVGARQLAVAYCLRGRLQSFIGLATHTSVMSVMEDFKMAEELDPTLPHAYLYRGALRHPDNLLLCARINNPYDANMTADTADIEQKWRGASAAAGESKDDKETEATLQQQEIDEEFFNDVGGSHVIQDLSMALDLLPSCTDAYILRASMYIRVAMFTPALHDLRAASLLDPDNIAVWLLVARIYLQHFHDYESAINATTFAIHLDPGQNAAYYIRAEAHLRGGEVDMALHDYTRILRNDPTEPWPWLFQGHILAARGRARLAMYSSIAFLRATGELTSKEIVIKEEAKRAELVAEQHKKSSFRALWKNHDDEEKATVNVVPEEQTSLDQANELLCDFNHAATQYRQAAMRHPTVHTYCRLADALVHLGDVTEALSVLHTALEMDDESPEVHATLGRLYLSVEDYDHALECFDTSIEFDPSDPLLFNARGVCKTLQEQTYLVHIRDLQLQQARTGEFEQLKDDFISASRSDDEDVFDEEDNDDMDYYETESRRKKKKKGRRKKRRGRKKKRGSSRSKSRSKSPKKYGSNKMSRMKSGKSPKKKKRKGGKRVKRKRQRLKLREKLSLRMAKTKREPYVPKTREQLELEVGMTGLRDINKCLALDPTNTDALLNRAELYVRAGEDQFASNDFETVLQLDPGNVRCYINRGVHQVCRSRPANAIQDFDRALSIDPANPLALYNRAVAYTDARQYDQAIQDYTRTLRTVPTAVAALRNRGLLQLWSENFANAKKDLGQVLELVQDSPEESESHDLLPALGHCDAQLGLLVPDALDAVNQAMNHRGGILVDALVSRGNVFYRLASAGYEFAPSSTFTSTIHRLRTHDEIIAASSIARLESEMGRASLNARSKSHSQWLEMSISDFSKALRLNPSSTIIRSNLAEALIMSADSLQRMKTTADAKQGDKGAGESVASVVGEVQYESLASWKKRKRKRIKLALVHFSAVLSMDPDSSSALNGRGMVHFKLGRMEEAYTDFSEALVKIDESMKEKRTLTEIIAIRKAMIQSASTSSGTSGNVVGLMTSSPRGVNKIAEALQKSKGLKAAKQRCQCLVNRAMVLIRAGSSKQAEQDLIAAVGLGDYHNFATPSALHDLATIKIRNEKTSAALELLDRAIQIPGHHVPQARMNRGVALCSTSPPNLAKAMEDFNAAVAAYPSNVHGLYNRAICLGMSGHLRAAEEDLMRAIAIAPGDSMLYDQRGKTMAAMGRPKVALKDYATAMLLE